MQGQVARCLLGERGDGGEAGLGIFGAWALAGAGNRPAEFIAQIAKAFVINSALNRLQTSSLR